MEFFLFFLGCISAIACIAFVVFALDGLFSIRDPIEPTGAFIAAAFLGFCAYSNFTAHQAAELKHMCESRLSRDQHCVMQYVVEPSVQQEG